MRELVVLWMGSWASILSDTYLGTGSSPDRDCSMPCRSWSRRLILHLAHAGGCWFAWPSAGQWGDFDLAADELISEDSGTPSFWKWYVSR